MASTTEPCKCYKKLTYAPLPCRGSADDLGESAREDEGSDSVESEREFAVNVPSEVEINDLVTEYPNVQSMELPLLFQEMEEILRGVSDYDVNIFSFWLIDIFLEGLLSAQEAGMNHRNQNATLHWISYMYNVVKAPHNKNNRREVFKRIKFMLLALDQEQEYVYDYEDIETAGHEETSESEGRSPRKPSGEKTKVWEVPYPPNTRFSTVSNVSSSAPDTSRSSVTVKKSPTWRSQTPRQIPLSTEEAEALSKENVRCMEVILEIVYRIFGRLWSFMQLQAVLHSMPYLTVVDLPFKLHVPRQVLKFDSVSSTKQDRAARKSFVQKASEDAPAGRNLSKKEFLLPLQLAEGMDAFLRDLFFLPSQESVLVEKGRNDKKKK